MARRSEEEERDWSADKRDFVADRRDTLAGRRESVADERDVVADARQAAMDAREAALDARERELDERAAELGVPVARARSDEAAARRSEERAVREHDRAERTEQGHQRDRDAVDRGDAAKRREASNPHTGLALAFAGIAELLYSADTFDEVRLRIARAAVSTVNGCEQASITLSEQGAHRTVASTDATALAVDRAQYDAGEGPCLDAVVVPVVYAASFPDRRWPGLAARPVDCGVRSAVSYRLAAARQEADGNGGSLNLYGSTPEAFSDEARQIGLILAAHASMAAGVASERRDLQALADGLRSALVSRDVIGQAKGILMERLKLTPEDAFEALRRSSQRLNEKLHAVALGITETGEFDPTDLSRG